MFGYLVTYDLKDCDWNSLTKSSLVDEWMAQLPSKLGFKRIDGPYTTPYFHEDPNESGVTSVVVLATSHISIHTFPYRNNFAYVDLSTCGDVNFELMDQVVKEFFKPTEIHKNIHKRGHVVKMDE